MSSAKRRKVDTEQRVDVQLPAVPSSKEPVQISGESSPDKPEQNAAPVKSFKDLVSEPSVYFVLSPSNKYEGYQ